MPKSGVHRNTKKSAPYTRQYNHNVDKIEIVPENRWKTSELSGDEHRYGFRANMYHKGKVVKTHYVNQGWSPELSVNEKKLNEMLKEANAPPDTEELERREPMCDHFGCTEPGDLYLLKHHNGPTEEMHTKRYCTEHYRRGDCAIIDNSSNLEKLE